MKPKTKIQRRFVEMAERLPELSEADRTWMRGLFKPQVRLFNLPHAGHAFHCQCCGHVSEMKGRVPEDGAPEWVCPECGAVCEVIRDRGPRYMSRYTTVETEKYCTKVDVFEGVQVFRNIVARRINYYGGRTRWEYSEVWQNWIQDDGREVITSRPYTRGINFFNWYEQGPVGIGSHNGHCSGYYEWNDVYDCYGHFVLPKPRFTGMLRRNGYAGWVVRLPKMNVAEAAMKVLTDPFAEELAKVGQRWLFRAYVREPSRFREREMRAAVRICVRNGYKVTDAKMWLDYVDDLIELGRDCRNRVYVCPDNLRMAHSWSDRMVTKKREREEFEERKAEALENEDMYRAMKSRYFGIVFGDDVVTISVLQSVADVLAEGIAMHHCVFNHGYWKEKDSLILSARLVKDGSRCETVEVSLKRFEVLQSRGLQNCVTKEHDRIVRLVRENMEEIKRAKRKRMKKIA